MLVRLTPRARARLHALAAAAGLLLLTTGVASAHAVLVRATPIDGATLNSAPDSIVLWFSEAVEPGLLDIRVEDGDGQTIPVVATEVDPGLPRRVTAALPPLSTGAYSIRWTLISADDSHPSRGRTVFGVGVPGIAPAQPALTAAAESAAASIYLASLVAALGAGLILALVLHAPRSPHLEPHVLRVVRQRVRRWAMVVTALAAFGALFQSGIQGSELAGATGWGALLGSRWGVLWEARIGLLAIYFVLLGAWAERRLALACLAAALALTQAAGTHAVLLPGALALLADATHLLGAAVWGGGVLALASAVLPAVRERTDRPMVLARAVWASFAPLALLSAAALAVTGIYTLWQQAGSVGAILASDYGRLALVKLGLLAPLCVAGGVNASAFQPLPRAFQRIRIARLRLWLEMRRHGLSPILGIEALLFLAMVALAVQLGISTPPRLTGVDAPSTSASLQTRTVDGLLTTVDVRPNRPGQNLLLVRAGSTKRPDPAPVQGVRVRMEPPDATRLAREETAVRRVTSGPRTQSEEYAVGTDNLDQPGQWRMTLIIDRQGPRTTEVPFTWTVAPVASTGPADPPGAPVAVLTGMLGLPVWWLLARWLGSRVRWPQPGASHPRPTRLVRSPALVRSLEEHSS